MHLGRAPLHFTWDRSLAWVGLRHGGADRVSIPHHSSYGVGLIVAAREELIDHVFDRGTLL